MPCDCRVSRDIKRERGFSERWPPAHDNQLRFLKAGKKIIKLNESGRDAAKLVAAGVKIFNPFVCGLEFFLEREKILRKGLLRNGKDFPFDVVQDILDLYRRI